MNESARSASGGHLAAFRIGISLLGLATIAAGILDLVWGDFDPGHQPIQALGVSVPGRVLFAYLTGIWMLVAGAALLWRRTTRMGIWATAFIYCIFSLFSVPRFYTMPHRYGFHLTLISGVIAEMFQQLIVVAGCLVLYLSIAPPESRWAAKGPLIARLVFGLSAVSFGLAHLTNPNGPAHMIPLWMPFSARFWILISGVGFMLSGLAILSGIVNRLASWMLAAMLLAIEVLLVPILFGYPHLHQAWGASAYNLAVAAAVLILAGSLPARQSMLAVLFKTATATNSKD
jgi:uncharacterized membrane protein YphA (DoxX/SURF4 family)